MITKYQDFGSAPLILNIQYLLKNKQQSMKKMVVAKCFKLKLLWVEMIYFESETAVLTLLEVFWCYSDDSGYVLGSNQPAFKLISNSVVLNSRELLQVQSRSRIVGILQYNWKDPFKPEQNSFKVKIFGSHLIKTNIV